MVINFNRLHKSLVIFLMGPTSCGKSLLAMKLREILPIELISVDSALIYREMNIGTAKPSNFELLKYPHFLINIRDPSEIYSVGDFYKDVVKVIKNVHSMNKVPLLVGGTMFYFKMLLEGLSILPPANNDIRNDLLRLSKRNHSGFLFNKLKLIDPISAKRIHPNDIQRILRALEVFFISGNTLTELTQKKNFIPYNVIQFSMVPKSKQWLLNNIKMRFKKMLSRGFEYEVKQLLNRGDLNSNLPSMRCVGYRQMWNYLVNNFNYDEMVYESLKATRRLAKSQLTWLKTWKNLNMLCSSEKSSVLITRIMDVINSKIIM